MSQIKFVGDPILEQKTIDVNINDLKINRFKKYQPIVDDLIKKVKKKGGCGIAAPQCGYNESIAVILTDGYMISNGEKIQLKNNKPLVIINPVFSRINDETTEDIEGCLSLPNQQFKITRWKHGVVSYYDLNGDIHTVKVTDFVGRVFQHEIDHLNGVILTMK